MDPQLQLFWGGVSVGALMAFGAVILFVLAKAFRDRE